MAILDNTIIYSCGHIESDQSCGDWRKRLATRLNAINPTIKLWDPLIKPSWMEYATSQTPGGIDIALDKPSMFSPNPQGMVSIGRRKRTWSANTEIREVCKGLAGGANIFIARLIDRFTWGSIDELEIAITRRVPIFFVLPSGPLGLYGIPGAISSPDLVGEYIHYTMESALAKIEAINSGVDNLPQRDPLKWLFLTYPDATKVKNAVPAN